MTGDAVENVYKPHNYTSTPEEAAALSIQNIELDCGTFMPDYLPGALQQGLFNVSSLDEAFIRQYTALVNLGYFNPPNSSVYRSYNWANVNVPSSQQLAHTAAVQGLTLLKNDGTLPLKEKNMTLALVGGWANATKQMQGNYNGIAPYLHSPLYAAQQLGYNVKYAPGPINGSYGSNYSDLVDEAVQGADMILYFGGIDTTVEAEALDRYEISWPQGQIDMINSVSSLGNPTVIVQMGGGQLDDSAWLKSSNISAIMWGGYPGQDGGPAIFDALTGAYPPAGRLPITQYPANYVNEVPMTNMSLRPGTDNPGRTYKWFSKPVIPFGYGLSYSTFKASFTKGTAKSSYKIASLTGGCSQAHLDLCPFANITATIQNTGNVKSDFVALAFLGGQFGPQPYPIKSLVGYQRVLSAAKGSSSTVTFPMTLANLARMDAQGNQVVYPGDYELMLDEPTQATLMFKLTGQQLVLDHFPQPPAAGESNGTIIISTSPGLTMTRYRISGTEVHTQMTI